MSTHHNTKGITSRLHTRHMNQRELAARWGMSVRTLERWRFLRQGPPFLKLGGRVAYRLDDVEAFEGAQRKEAGTA
ncbi:AlpA family transcriptional regulator [Falsiroseomonas sp.]|uniref:helix-turn-helix transcriptional regulator n=1 Tax=Falsiroseomonas sp. TaxID=2870721 RepID=UPI00271E61D7|nr:DNA-binding protein [Falsiroseomonas sp.]MDO9502718.1 DNA-binding protein [Falsiroseomonas sp.]